MRSWRTTGAARGRLKRASGRRSDRRFSALVDRVDQGREALATAKAMRRGRGAPGKVEVVDVLFAGPPPYEAADAWSDEKVNAWAQASVAWLRARAPTAYIFGAYLHRDERSPHLHVLFVPITDDGRLSWNRIEKGFAADADAGLKGGAILRSAQLRPDSAWGVGRSGRASDTSPDFRGLTKQGGPQRELVQNECIGLPDLPGFSRTIYRYLLQCVDNRASRQWADSYEAIAARIGFSRRTVRRYMPALV